MSDPTRDYKKEYAEYHSTPEAKRDRAKRNLWNRRLKGKVPPGKEIDHTVPLSRGGSNDRDNIRFRDVSENRGHGMSKRAAPLTSRGRNQVAEGNFALPGRRYPIHDISHARNALSRVAQHGTRGEQEAVRSAVEARYPSLKKEGEFMPLYKEASVPFSTRTFTPGYTLGGAVLGGAAGLATSGQSGARALGGAGALSEEEGRDANPFLRAAIGAGLGALGGYGVKRLRDASHLSDFANLKEGDKVLKAHHYAVDNPTALPGESAKDFVLRMRAARGNAKETTLFKGEGEKILGVDTSNLEAIYDRGSKKTHFILRDPKNPANSKLVSNVDANMKTLRKRDYVSFERANVDKAFKDDVSKQRGSARLQGAAALAAAGGVGGALALSSREKRASWVMSSLTFAKLAGVEYRGHTFPGYNQPIEAPAGDTHKMMVLAKKGGDVKLVRFGHRAYKHNYSPEAKANYLKRSAGIRDKSGNLTKDDPFSPNYWARKHLWPRNQEADGSALKKQAAAENYRHRATILLRDKEGRVLAVPQKRFNTILFPGGGIHEDERFDMPTEAEIIEGARREAREELGHDLANPRYIGDLRNEMDERFREHQTLKRGVPIHGLHEHYVVAERGRATPRAHGSAGDTFQGDYMPVDDILWHMDKDARGLSEGAGHAAREAALIRKHLTEKQASFMKEAVDVQGLRSMWQSTVKPLYARPPRSYSKAARTLMDHAATAEGVKLERGVAQKLNFPPTPNLPEFSQTQRANEAVALLPHAKADAQIGYGKGLIDADGLTEGALAGRRALITRRAKTYANSGGVVYVQPGSSYANLAKKDRAKDRAVNRFRSKLKKTPPKQDYSVRSGLSGEDQEVFNRIVGGHESMEVRTGARRDMRYRKEVGSGNTTRGTLSDSEFQSHVMPSVILRNDMNIVNTLPEGNRLVKERFMQMRTPEIQDLIKELPQHKDSLQAVLQGKRLSRHVINKIDRDYAAAKGWQKATRSEMTRRRAGLRAVRERLSDPGAY
jgi:NUDIX domain